MLYFIFYAVELSRENAHYYVIAHPHIVSEGKNVHDGSWCEILVTLHDVGAFVSVRFVPSARDVWQ